MAILVRSLNPAFPEGVMLAILFGNVFAPLIDFYVLKANVKATFATHGGHDMSGRDTSPKNICCRQRLKCRLCYLCILRGCCFAADPGVQCGTRQEEKYPRSRGTSG